MSSGRNKNIIEQYRTEQNTTPKSQSQSQSQSVTVTAKVIALVVYLSRVGKVNIHRIEGGIVQYDI